MWGVLKRLKSFVGKLYVLSPISFAWDSGSFEVFYHAAYTAKLGVRVHRPQNDPGYRGLLIFRRTERIALTAKRVWTLTLLFPKLPMLAIGWERSIYVGLSEDEPTPLRLFGLWSYERKLRGALGSTEAYYSPLLTLPRPQIKATCFQVVLRAVGDLPARMADIYVLRVPTHRTLTVQYIYKVMCQPPIPTLNSTFEFCIEPDPGTAAIFKRTVRYINQHRARMALQDTPQCS